MTDTHTAENNTFLQLRLRAVKFFNTNLPTSSQEVKFPELPAALLTSLREVKFSDVALVFPFITLKDAQ